MNNNRELRVADEVEESDVAVLQMSLKILCCLFVGDAHLEMLCDSETQRN